MIRRRSLYSDTNSCSKCGQLIQRCVCFTPPLQLPPEYLELVNDILGQLHSEQAIGAYCVGFVSVLAWREKQIPDRRLLETASKCERIPEAFLVFDEWKKSRSIYRKRGVNG